MLNFGEQNYYFRAAIKPIQSSVFHFSNCKRRNIGKEDSGLELVSLSRLIFVIAVKMQNYLSYPLNTDGVW